MSIQCDGWNGISREVHVSCQSVRACGIHIDWYPETPIIICAQIEQNGLCREEQQEVLVFGLDPVLDAKGTYPGNGRVINPCVQTLQSLGTVAGASHQELQCRLHNPDIESRILIVGLCVVSDVNDVLRYLFFFFQLAYPLLLFMWFCVRGFSFAMIVYCWCEQSLVQMMMPLFRAEIDPPYSRQQQF